MKQQKNQPLVSIITVAFNLIKGKREKFFRQCLESVHNQTYKNIEHLIIDGGSTDGTKELIEEYKAKGWISYISEKDNGIYDAMNKGVSLSKGKYLAFLNSDDFYNRNDAVSDSVAALEQSGADFSYAPINMINEDGSKIFSSHPFMKPEIQHCFFVMPFCHQTMFTKRDVMIKEKMFDTDFKNAGDYDLVLRLCLKKYRSVIVKKAFATFRVGGFSEIYQAQNAEEVAESYFNNYKKLCQISKQACSRIYCKGYARIPENLALKLKDYQPYFDYNEYRQSLKLKNRLKTNISFVSEKLISETKSSVANPKKSIKKIARKLRLTK